MKFYACSLCWSIKHRDLKTSENHIFTVTFKVSHVFAQIAFKIKMFAIFCDNECGYKRMFKYTFHLVLQQYCYNEKKASLNPHHPTTRGPVRVSDNVILKKHKNCMNCCCNSCIFKRLSAEWTGM